MLNDCAIKFVILALHCCTKIHRISCSADLCARKRFPSPSDVSDVDMQKSGWDQTVSDKLANVEEVNDDDATDLYEQICGGAANSESSLVLRPSFRASRNSSTSKGEQSASLLLTPTGGRNDQRYSKLSSPLDDESESEDDMEEAMRKAVAHVKGNPDIVRTCA